MQVNVALIDLKNGAEKKEPESKDKPSLFGKTDGASGSSSMFDMIKKPEAKPEKKPDEKGLPAAKSLFGNPSVAAAEEKKPSLFDAPDKVKTDTKPGTGSLFAPLPAAKESTSAPGLKKENSTIEGSLFSAPKKPAIVPGGLFGDIKAAPSVPSKPAGGLFTVEEKPKAEDATSKESNSVTEKKPSLFTAPAGTGGASLFQKPEQKEPPKIEKQKSISEKA